MNKEETWALFKQGKRAWNSWAEEMLVRRQALAEDNTWPMKTVPPVDKVAVDEWLDSASADFSRREFGIGEGEFFDWLFPSSVRFNGCIFSDDVSFGHTIFPATVELCDSKFRRSLSFANVTFEGGLRVQDAEFIGEVYFSNAVFYGNTDFSGSIFNEYGGFDSCDFGEQAKFFRTKFLGSGATFAKAHFNNFSDFSQTEFRKRCLFGEAAFDRLTLFEASSFQDLIDFQSTEFTGDVSFNDSVFDGAPKFNSATFKGRLSLRGTNFGDEASFGGVTVFGSANFDDACFSDIARFEGVTFQSVAKFNRSQFLRDALFNQSSFNDGFEFNEAVFLQSAWFRSIFSAGDCWFEKSVFKSRAWFSEAFFVGDVWFLQSTFEGMTSFRFAVFQGLSVFTASKSTSGFALESTLCRRVPDFEQTTFTEAPRLDSFTIRPQRFLKWREFHKGNSWDFLLTMVPTSIGEWAAENLKGNLEEVQRWRSLRSLAVSSHDHGKEQEFFRRELKARRFVAESWYRTLFFNFPYQIMSDFGNSLRRPIFFLMVAIIVSAGFYLSRIQVSNPPGFKEALTAVLTEAVPHVFLGGEITHSRKCASTLVPRKVDSTLQESILPGDPVLSALALSAKNSLVFASGVLGVKDREVQACLYGLQRIGAREEPGTPTMVAFIGGLQMLFSLVLIFLFGLALRNHFKIK